MISIVLPHCLLSCYLQIDNFFTPVLLQKTIHDAFDTGPTTYLDAYSVPSVLVHTKMNVKHYSYFRTESRPPTAPVDNNFSTLNATQQQQQQQQQQRGSIGLSAPVLPARIPPGYNNNNAAHVDDVDSASSHNNDDDSQSLSTKASTSAPSEYNYNLVALGVSSFASKSNNRTSTPNRLTLSKGIVYIDWVDRDDTVAVVMMMMMMMTIVAMWIITSMIIIKGIS